MVLIRARNFSPKAEARRQDNAFQSALDWLADGVALLSADGKVVYANEAFQRIVRGNDGIRVARRMVAFAALEAAARLAAALGAAARLQAGDPDADGMRDFSVLRPSGALPYVISLRPLLHGDAGRAAYQRPVAVLFVHDPQQRAPHAAQIFREALGLTEAEANLALALQEGMGVADYARAHALSINTAYTHLRRIKEKTGCKQLGELVRWLNDLRLPLRGLLLAAIPVWQSLADALAVCV
jgi:DNA-binding CsgD family transcriptional regulator